MHNMFLKDDILYSLYILMRLSFIVYAPHSLCSLFFILLMVDI